MKSPCVSYMLDQLTIKQIRFRTDPSIRISYLIPIFYPYFMEITIKANIKSIFMKHDLIHLLEIHSKYISKLPTMMLSNEKNVNDEK